MIPAASDSPADAAVWIWFASSIDEFFEINRINQKSFDKTEGLDFYNLFNNNNKIIIYTVEKINLNIDNINKIFNP